MSWSNEDGKHEAWAAPTFADGALGTGWSGQGVQVSRIGTQVLDYDDWQYRPEHEVIGWTTVCECGWRGPMWTRVATAAEQDLTKRLVYSPDSILDDDIEDDACYPEWKQHIAPTVALASVEQLAGRKAAIERELGDAIEVAKAAGASPEEITRAQRPW